MRYYLKLNADLSKLRFRQSQLWYPARMDQVSTDLTRYKHTHTDWTEARFNGRQLVPVLKSTAHALMANTAQLQYTNFHPEYKWSIQIAKFPNVNLLFVLEVHHDYSQNSWNIAHVIVGLEKIADMSSET